MRHYKNLDEAWLDINRSFLVKPHETVQFVRGAQGFIEDLVMKVDEPVTSINLWQTAFNPDRKWNHLIRSYIEPDEYWAFWEGVKKVTGTSYQFRFKNKLTSNGPCLIAIVLTRNETKQPWTRAKIIWRTAELQRKFAADLVLIHNFFREIPEDCREKINIKETTLFLSQAFQSWRLVGPLVDLFCNLDEIDTTHEYGQLVHKNHAKVYEEPQPELKFSPVIRMQKFYRSKKEGNIPHSHPDDLSLVEEVKKIQKQKGKRK